MSAEQSDYDVKIFKWQDSTDVRYGHRKFKSQIKTCVIRHMANAQSIIVFVPNLLDSCSLSTLFIMAKLKVRPGINILDPWHLLH